MADITILSRLVNAIQRNVNISSNTLVVSSLKMGTSELEKADLDTLTLTTDSSSAVNASALHIHDGRYFTESELGSTANGSAGASLIGIDQTPAFTNISGANAQALFESIDSAIGSATHDAITLNADTTTQQTLNLTTQELQVNKAGATNDGAMSQEDFNKLAGIEASADVTDATNVNAAGATMNSDTTLAGNGYFLDEDAMGSDSATKVASQQSVKAYVDTEVASAVAGGATFKGDYNATTDTPSLDDGSPIAGITTGDMYVCTTAGTFFTIVVEIGDILISKQDSPTVEAHWTVVQANLTAASIKSQYESNSNTNAFTDADETKLDGIEASATADQTGAEIKSAYEGEADTNAFTDAEKTLLGNQSGTNTGDEATASTTVQGVVELATITETNTGSDATRAITPAGLAGSALQTKVDGIESGATADQTGAEIKSAYEGESNTNAFTDADETKLDGIEASADVTDATNVNAAGATMNADTDVSSNGWVLDEDDLSTDSATKLATQQSIKAYVDNEIAASSPDVLDEDMVAGVSFAANTSFWVRMALSGETAGRIYKADKGAGAEDSETNTIYVIGLAQNRTASPISAGGSIPVVKWGEAVLQSSDAAFTAVQDEGLPIYLGAAGAIALTAPGSANDAQVLCGTVRNVGGSSSIEIGKFQILGIKEV